MSVVVGLGIFFIMFAFLLAFQVLMAFLRSPIFGFIVPGMIFFIINPLLVLFTHINFIALVLLNMANMLLVITFIFVRLLRKTATSNKTSYQEMNKMHIQDL